MHLQKLLTFFSKNTCELNTVLTRTVNILTTNKLVKLTMFEQLGPDDMFKTAKWMANGIDPDQMPHTAAFEFT